MSWSQLRATRSLLRHATRGERLEVLDKRMGDELV